MPRLNKALKELNVGINRVAEFLQKKGFPLEDASVNAKITDEQYTMLLNEFGSDMLKQQETHLNIQKRKEQESQERAQKAKERRERENDEKKKGVFRLDSERKLTEFKVVGNINDIQRPTTVEQTVEQPAAASVQETASPTTTVQAEEVPMKEETEKKADAPAETEQKPQPADIAAKQENVTQTAETAVKETRSEAVQQTAPATSAAETPQPEKKDGVFRTPTPDAGVSFKQVGFIDLDSLNSRMRPDKKNKSERKKERDEKDRTRADGKNRHKEPVAREATSGNKGDDSAQSQNKKKRQRINKGKVDINAVSNQPNAPKQSAGKGNGGGNQGGGKPQQRFGQSGGNQQEGGKKNRNKKKDVKLELTDEEVAKQVKETLARLTTKSVKSSVKNRKEKRERHRQEVEEGEHQNDKVLQLTEFVTVNELATMMNVPVTKVIATCMSIGVMVSINQRLDAETINMVAEEFGFQTNYVSGEVSNAIVEEEDREEDLVPRAPIITVMGHVDHGKTSLLDYIRKTNVIAGEAGGITQHIGAYNVKMKDGRHITFLDTPGHEAFTAMRARGAQVTDIAIIIIAADDAIMPQTREAIAHAQAAGVPMVFAINKIDKPGANPEKIKEQLANMNLLVEDWGGKYQCQEISAKKGVGVDELMEKVLLEAEMLNLKANPDRKATGSIIESTLDKGRGYVATILCQNGTLHQGDIVLAGTHYGRIRAMFNERGQKMNEALPAEPAVILGLNGAPTAGDTFHVMDTEQEAREICNKREQLKREQGLRTMKRVDLNELGRRIALGDFKELNLVVKGDVDGSIEALSDSLIKLSTEKIQVNVIHKAVGQISESDVTLAAASDAIIIGFQVRPSQAARKLAEQEGVDIRLYSVIYDTIEEVKSAMEGMLAPETKEEVTATLEVRQVYHITKVGTVAGAFVTSGKVQRSNKVRVIREGIVVYTGQINALKRFKDDVKEVGVNFECGISIVNYDNIREGDILETFAEVEVKQKL